MNRVRKARIRVQAVYEVFKGIVFPLTPVVMADPVRWLFLGPKATKLSVVCAGISREFSSFPPYVIALSIRAFFDLRWTLCAISALAVWKLPAWASLPIALLVLVADWGAAETIYHLQDVLEESLKHESQ
jgi:hypothetical protein